MKNYFLYAFILFSLHSISQISYPQNITFHTRDESASYQDQNGKIKYEQVSNQKGSYEIQITKAAEVRNSPIIQIYGDNNEKGYYAFSSTFENVKMGEKLFEANLFFSTATNTGVKIYFAYDKSSLIIMSKNKVIRYY